MGRSQRSSFHSRHLILSRKKRTNLSIVSLSLVDHSLSQKDLQSPIIENALFITSLHSLNLGNVYKAQIVWYSVSLRTLIISESTVPA